MANEGETEAGSVVRSCCSHLNKLGARAKAELVSGGRAIEAENFAAIREANPQISQRIQSDSIWTRPIDCRSGISATCAPGKGSFSGELTTRQGESVSQIKRALAAVTSGIVANSDYALAGGIVIHKIEKIVGWVIGKRTAKRYRTAAAVDRILAGIAIH